MNKLIVKIFMNDVVRAVEEENRDVMTNLKKE